MKDVRVWDPVVRITHWALATCIAIDLLNEAGANAWHRYIGYAAGALVVARLLWGVIGSDSARLASIARTAAAAARYVRSSRGAAEMYLAHNPLGACMAFTLWALALFVVATGVLLQIEAFWGDDLVQSLHAYASYALAALALVHVAGAIVTSARNRMNLVKAMITGHKKLAEQ